MGTDMGTDMRTEPTGAGGAGALGPRSGIWVIMRAFGEPVEGFNFFFLY